MVDSAILVMEDTMARGLLTPTLRPTMVDSAMPDMEDFMARGLLTPRPIMVVLAMPAMADLAILVMEDTMARGPLTLTPTMVDSAMPVMAMVLDTDTLDKLQIRKYCGELQTLKL